MASAHALSGGSSTTLYLTEPGDTSAISVDDIHQGQIGDCYLLSAIGELALFDRSAISNMIASNPDGSETVTLHKAASGALPSFGTTAYRPVSVTVANSFPADAANNGATQDVVDGQKEIWVQVLEKAVATLGGGYGSITNGGNPALAMEELTGQVATPTQPASMTAQSLQADVAAGDLLTFDTGQNAGLPDGLVSDHAYMFDDLTTVNGSEDVQLLNPWGFDEPSLIPVSSLASSFVEIDVGHAAAVTPSPPARPSIGGVVATQATSDETTIRPFAHLTLTGVAATTAETATVTLSSAGNGAMSQLGGGQYDSAQRTYTVVGTASSVTAALDGLVFTPTAHQVAPRSSETTVLALSVGGSAASTAIVATAVADPPQVAGAVASVATIDTTPVRPFASVTVTEPDAGQVLTASVGLSMPGNGVLSDASGGHYSPSSGIYTVSGSVSAVRAALDGLVFTPTAHQVAAGRLVSTALTMTVTDTAGATGPIVRTTVTATATGAAGAHSVGPTAPSFLGVTGSQPTTVGSASALGARPGVVADGVLALRDFASVPPPGQASAAHAPGVVQPPGELTVASLGLAGSVLDGLVSRHLLGSHGGLPGARE